MQSVSEEGWLRGSELEEGGRLRREGSRTDRQGILFPSFLLLLSPSAHVLDLLEVAAAAASDGQAGRAGGEGGRQASSREREAELEDEWHCEEGEGGGQWIKRKGKHRMTGGKRGRQRDGKEEANLERFGASCSCTASYLISVF